ncbi:hypothetical protein ACXY7D_00030 [Sphingomonas melonis]
MQSAFASAFAPRIAAPATAQCVQPPAVGHSDIGPADELGRPSWMYELALIGGSLTFRRACAAPIRPVAIALRR